MTYAPPQRAGMAAGTVNTVRQLGYALGVALLGLLYRDGGGYAALNDVYLASAITGVVAGLLVLVTVAGPRPR
jgi:predicted MFS family arabinose efflux permease